MIHTHLTLPLPSSTPPPLSSSPCRADGAGGAQVHQHRGRHGQAGAGQGGEGVQVWRGLAVRGGGTRSAPRMCGCGVAGTMPRAAGGPWGRDLPTPAFACAPLPGCLPPCWGPPPPCYLLLSQLIIACLVPAPPCRDGTTKILISTDVLSRGFDVTQAWPGQQGAGQLWCCAAAQRWAPSRALQAPHPAWSHATGQPQGSCSCACPSTFPTPYTRKAYRSTSPTVPP